LEQVHGLAFYLANAKEIDAYLVEANESGKMRKISRAKSLLYRSWNNQADLNAQAEMKIRSGGWNLLAIVEGVHV